MAKVLNPLMSQEAIGSLGAITFSKWRALRTVRGKANPARRFRTVQTVNRARLGYLSRQWSTLTDAQRELWRGWARVHPEPDGFGGTFILTGEQAFIMLNIQVMRLFAGATGLLVPPIAGIVSGVASLVMSAPGASGTFTATWTADTGNIVGDKFEVSIAGPFQSPGKIAVEGKYKSFSTVTGTTLTLLCTGQQAGAWYWCRVRYCDQTGQVSAWVDAQVQAKP